MFNVIFTVVLSLILLLFTGLGLLSGRKYLWYYSLTKAIITLASAIGSFFLSKVIAKPIGDLVYKTLMTKLPESIMAYVKDVESAPLVLGALVTVILAPIFFILLFFVIKFILNLIAKIVCKSVAKAQLKKNPPADIPAVSEEQTEVTAEQTSTDAEASGESEELVTEAITVKTVKKAKKAKKPKKIRPLRAKGANPAGMACGFACGLIIFVVLSIPVSGVFAVANDVTVTLAGLLPDNATYETVTEITDASVNNPISKAVSTIYGNKLFESLTTAEMGEHELSLTKEIRLLTTVGNAVFAVMDGDKTQEEAAAEIREIIPAFEDSSMLPTLAPELFASANESWEKGESFHGIKKISLGAAQPLVDPMIDALASSDYDSFKEDTCTIIEILAILTEHDAITSVKSDPMGIMENEAMTSDIIYNLLENDHFVPVVEGVATFGIQFLGEKLHFHAHKDALYEEFLTSANETIPPAIIDGTGAEAPLSELFDNFGLDVSEDSISSMAKKMTVSNVTAVLTTEKLVLDTDHATISASNARAASSHQKTIVLNTPEVLAENSLLICTDQISVSVADISDKAYEAKALAKAIHEIMSITSTLTSGNVASANAMQSIGPILDALSSTKIIGSTATEYIVVGIFQSDLVHDSIGLTLVDATDIAHTICNKSHTVGFAPILKSVADTVEVVKLASSDSTSREEFNEKVGALISDLTPETTEVLQKITTREAVEKKGVGKESSEQVSSLISNVLGNLTAAKEEGMSDEQYEKEAAATSNLLNVALSASASKKANIFADPDSDNSDSAISMTASEYVDSVLDSDVISNTVIETVYAEDGSINENPLNIKKNLSESDHKQVTTALTERWNGASAEEKANEEYAKKYTAVGHIINIPVEIIDGELVFTTVEK